MTAHLTESNCYCRNPNCSEYKILNSPFVTYFGKTMTGVQRIFCRKCRKTATVTKDTIFYRLRTPIPIVEETLSLISDGASLEGIQRAKGLNPETVRLWLKRAAEHVEEVQKVLFNEFIPEVIQIDGMYSFVLHKGKFSEHPETNETGIFWVIVVLEKASRLRLFSIISKSEDEAAYEVMLKLKTDFGLDKPPMIATDGKDAYAKAILDVWGIIPEYSGKGRPPQKKIPGDDWKCLQVVKTRERGEIVDVKINVVYGDADETIKIIGPSTSYVERTHLTSRMMNRRLSRKTIGFSKQHQIHVSSIKWMDAVYNLVRPLRTLKERVSEYGRIWKQRTPAMAANLTDHIWSIKNLLITNVVF